MAITILSPLKGEGTCKCLLHVHVYLTCCFVLLFKSVVNLHVALLQEKMAHAKSPQKQAKLKKQINPSEETNKEGGKEGGKANRYVETWNIPNISERTEVSTKTEIPTKTELSTKTEFSSKIELSTKTKIPTKTEFSSKTELSTKTEVSKTKQKPISNDMHKICVLANHLSTNIQICVNASGLPTTFHIKKETDFQYLTSPRQVLEDIKPPIPVFASSKLPPVTGNSTFAVTHDNPIYFNTTELSDIHTCTCTFLDLNMFDVL